MKPILLLVASILAVSHAASVMPIDSSSVYVKQSGQDYSYSVQENHGIAIEPSDIIHPQMPITKTAQIPMADAGSGIHINQVGEEESQHDQQLMQVQAQEHVQGRVSEQMHEQATQLQPQPILQSNQQQAKAMHYFAPTLETYQILPTNVQYGLPYPYDLHHPYNIIRII